MGRSISPLRRTTTLAHWTLKYDVFETFNIFLYRFKNYIYLASRSTKQLKNSPNIKHAIAFFPKGMLNLLWTLCNLKVSQLLNTICGKDGWKGRAWWELPITPCIFAISWGTKRSHFVVQDQSSYLSSEVIHANWFWMSRNQIDIRTLLSKIFTSYVR